MSYNYESEYSDESSRDSYSDPGNVRRQGIKEEHTQIENQKFHNELNTQIENQIFHDELNRHSSNKFCNEPISDKQDDESLKTPPTKNISRYIARARIIKNNHDEYKPLLCGCITICLLLIIITIFSVGIAKGLFFYFSSEVTDDNSLSYSYHSPDGSERANRLREYLITVAVNGVTTFKDPISSPESQALAWIQYEDPMELDPNKLESHFRIKQRFALLTLWFQSDFDWYNQTNWLTEDECTWKGVTCTTVSPGLRRSLIECGKGNERTLRDGDKIVNTLNLEHNNLQGSLPPDLFLLKYLISLNLSGNYLRGAVHEGISSMSLLEELYLDHNQFEGIVPDSLYSVTALNQIRLDNNKFIGQILDNIGNLINLVVFTADSNQFNGTIPISFGSLDMLEDLSLRNNTLTGGLSSELLSVTTLRSLDLSINALTGSIPSFSMMENLTTLSLGYNNFSGEFTLGSMRNLKKVILEKNKFSGRLPDLSNSLRIQILRIGENNFDSQAFPTNILKITNLTNLGLNSLSLTGEIPFGIGTLTRLTVLNLESNLLDGNIPLSIAEISPLKEFIINKNKLTGRIPFEISFLKNLEILNLSSNQFESNIPIAIGGLTSLKTLTIGSNYFEGQLPSSIRFLSNLEVLNLADNSFTGSIPYSIWRMSSLRQLILANNNFVGQIPGSVENLIQLQVLNIASNTFRGRIPDSITSLKKLSRLDLSFNFFGGPIPDNIGDLIDLRELLIGTNYDDSDKSFGFDGTIPVSIGSMNKLERLELNRNRISGVLPSHHGLMNSIQVYDVSGNKRLGGTLPEYFIDMSQLNELKFYDTDIEGGIPVNLCDMDVAIEVDCGKIKCSCCECNV